MPEPEKDEYLYSPVVSQGTTATFAVGSNLTWDSFWRQVYENSNKVIQRQANELLKRGNLVEAEVRALVEGQRNALVLKIRQFNSPFGRLYSEILKPSSKLPTLQQLVAQKGSLEAVLTSVGKSRAVVNRFAAVSRVAGPATIVLQITCPPWLSTPLRRKSEDGSPRVKAEAPPSACSVGGVACGQGALGYRLWRPRAW